MKGEIVMAKIRPGIEFPIIPEDIVEIEEEPYSEKTDKLNNQNLKDESTQDECDYSAA
jgi:hypothetical protein